MKMLLLNNLKLLILRKIFQKPSKECLPPIMLEVIKSKIQSMETVIWILLNTEKIVEIDYIHKMILKLRLVKLKRNLLSNKKIS